jgi:hypothetical protein
MIMLRTAIEEIDPVAEDDAAHGLAALVGMHDPLGVLTVYAEPGAGSGIRHAPRAGEISVRHRIREELEALREARPHAEWAAIEARLRDLEPALAELFDPGGRGAGRALFAPLSGGTARRVALWRAVPSAVHIAPLPVLLPLLAVLSAGRPAGLVVTTGRTVRAVDWRRGRARDVLRSALPDESAEWRRLQGPASSNPAQAQHSSSQRDLFETRRRAHRERLVAAAGARLAALARRHGWDWIVLGGEPHMARALRDHLPPLEGGHVMAGAIPGEAADAFDVAKALAPHLERARAARQLALVHRALDVGRAAGGAGAVGPGETLDALRAGAVHRLLVDPGHRLTGRRGPGGELAVDGEVPPGVPEERLEAEPCLMDRLVELTLASRAEVVPVEGEAARVLAGADGVAALLRW